MENDYGVLSDFLDCVFERKDYGFAKIRMIKRVVGNRLAFLYRDRVSVGEGGGMSFDSESGRFVGVILGDYDFLKGVSRVIYPEIRKEDFESVLYGNTRKLIKSGFCLDYLVVARDVCSVGDPISDGIEKPNRDYVMYDDNFGFSMESPTIVVCDGVVNKKEIKDFSKKAGVDYYEYCSDERVRV